MMCGLSGLPKFRQFVAPMESRSPTSHVAAGLGHGGIAPSRGSDSTPRVSSSAIASHAASP